MLLQCSLLYLLSMPQLVVLLGIAAADVYSNSDPQPHREATPTLRDRFSLNETAVSLGVKSRRQVLPQVETSSEQMEIFEDALHHIEETTLKPLPRCGRPTRYVLKVNEYHQSGLIFMPECVVVHRCMNYSGCCSPYFSNRECVPMKTKIITKSFLVKNPSVLPEYVSDDTQSNDYDTSKYTQDMAVSLSFVTHTRCGCKRKARIPKCKGKCPTHFRLSQEGANCVCDCFPLANVDSRLCENIKDGLEPVSAKEQRCIRRGRCYKPTCAEGAFHEATGFCPLTEANALSQHAFENPEERFHYRKHLTGFSYSESDIHNSGETLEGMPTKIHSFH